ncbi:phosphoprotein [Gata virus]|uniref:Phosphoprotein n=1 Tax=Gata virus TaxID=1911435 RepID=A0A2Z2CF62_9RHAB|nr:phosphoprotein [Gata virus]AOX47531.1 phosphoprotein [Gata virus]
MKKTQQHSLRPIMDELNEKFKQFLDDGARQNILSDEFKRDVNAILGEMEDEEMPLAPNDHSPVRQSTSLYSPDHDLDTYTDPGCQSPPGSVCDPLDDEACSILGELERIVTLSDPGNQWEGASHIVWTSPGVYSTGREFQQAKTLLKSVLRSMNRDSGLNYVLNVGKPDTLFITRPDSLTVARNVRPKIPENLFVDNDKWEFIKAQFASGIELKDVDEPGKTLVVSFATPGFKEGDIKLSFLNGNTTVRSILEDIWRAMGRWAYISSSYHVDGIVV